MKKILLSLSALVATAFCAQAEVVTDASVDFTTMTSYPYYKSSALTPTFDDGVLNIVNETAQNSWSLQYFLADGISFNPNAIYTVSIEVKGSAAGSANTCIGTWSATSNYTLNFTTEWQTVTFRMTSIPLGSGHVLMQSGNFVGTIQYRNITITHDTDTEGALVEGNVIDGSVDFSKYTSYSGSFYDMSGGVAQINADGELEVVNETSQYYSLLQYFVISSVDLVAGNDYKVTAVISGSVAGSVRVGVGNWSAGQTEGFLNVTGTGYDTLTTRILDAKVNDSNQAFVVFKTGDYVGTLKVKTVTISHDEVVEEPENPTSINSLQADERKVNVIYNLLGKRVMTDVNSLPAGIYIINGRKQLVK